MTSDGRRRPESSPLAKSADMKNVAADGLGRFDVKHARPGPIELADVQAGRGRQRAGVADLTAHLGVDSWFDRG